MRWQRFFDDLEAEAGELVALERDEEITERTRVEVASVRWLERLRGSLGRHVTLDLQGAGPVRGTVGYVGPDWVLLSDGLSEALVPMASVLTVEGAARAAPATTGPVPLTWAAAWRRLAADRAVVRLTRVDGARVRGKVRQVGADFVEIDRGSGLPVLMICWAGVAVVHAADAEEL
ncbi:hypothetical protein BH24ACT11_BH24ACT11_05590 [soil metagenome]